MSVAMLATRNCSGTNLIMRIAKADISLSRLVERNDLTRCTEKELVIGAEVART
jgi:hypothetical protein